MSAIVKTITPFIDKEILLKALDCLGCSYTVVGNTITTNRIDYYGNQKFEYNNNRYQFVHEDTPWQNYGQQDYKTVSSFLQSVEKEYNRMYAEKCAELERLRKAALQEQERLRLEEEKKRIEQERLAYIEKQKQIIIQKAQAEGYSVQEKKVNNKIKLVLRRNTY
ncbi:MAG: hypothetical protein ACTTH7_06765 [Treponema sp.]